jgi:hypothetical protein
MQEPTTKQELLDLLQQERADWEALVAEIGGARMELSGVTGVWTMKDTIAHLTTWWRREVARLAAAQRNERPPEHPPQTDVAVINQWVYLLIVQPFARWSDDLDRGTSQSQGVRVGRYGLLTPQMQ